MGELLSVIIPVYNCQNSIEDCLQSLQDQKYDNFEAIIVDDGSMDRSAEIIKDFVAKDTRFKYLRKENEGVSSARNYGLENARGEYITFLDSDDTVERSIYELSINALENSDAEIVFYDFYYVYSDYKIVEKIMDVASDTVLPFESKKLLLFSGGYAWNKVARRTIIGNTRFDKSIAMCEDLLFWYQVTSCCHSFVYLNCPLYNYVQHGQSICNRAVNDAVLTFMNAYETMLRMEKDSKLRRDIAYLYMNNIVVHISKAISKNRNSEKRRIIKLLSDKAYELNETEKLAFKQKIYILLLKINPNLANAMFKLRAAARKKVWDIR